jgi:hypothetical protein
MTDFSQDEVECRLRILMQQVADVIELRLLSPEERRRVQEFEEQAQEAGAAGGILPFVNQGVMEALASDAVYAVLTGPMKVDPPEPWTVFLDDDDQLIGEWLPESRVEEARASGRCIFLSDDFVMYKDRKPSGRGRFVMPFICLEQSEGEPFKVAGIGSPSGPADLYLRSLMGRPGTELATLLLGVRFE